MTGPSTGGPDRFRDLLAPYVLGMLPEPTAARVQAHLEGCADCRELAELLAPDADLFADEAGHIPADLLLRWEEIRPTLEGLEREVYARHLAGCDSCRGVLARRGVAPGLADAAPPSGGRGRARAAAPRAAGAWRRPGARRWLIVAGAVAAVAVAVSVGLRLRTPARVEVAQAPTTPGPAPSPAPAPTPGSRPGGQVAPPATTPAPVTAPAPRSGPVPEPATAPGAPAPQPAPAPTPVLPTAPAGPLTEVALAARIAPDLRLDPNRVTSGLTRGLEQGGSVRAVPGATPAAGSTTAPLSAEAPRYAVEFEVGAGGTTPATGGRGSEGGMAESPAERSGRSTVSYRVVDRWTGAVVEGRAATLDTTNLDASLARTAGGVASQLARRAWAGVVAHVSGAEIELRGSGTAPPAVGEAIQLLERGRDILDARTGRPRGFEVSRIGTARVLRVEGDRWFARIESGSGRVKVGQTAVVAGGR